MSKGLCIVFEWLGKSAFRVTVPLHSLGIEIQIAI